MRSCRGREWGHGVRRLSWGGEQGVLVVRAEGGGIWLGKSRGKGAEGLEAAGEQRVW